ELDALATRLIAESRAPAVARAIVERLTRPAECSEMLGEPLAADAEAVRALYARMVAANGRGTGAAARAAALAAIEREALAIGDRELAGRAAVSLGMRQIEADELTAADASLARGHDLAVALHDTATMVTALIERAVVAEQSGDASAARSFGKLARELADKPGAPPLRRAQVYYSLARIELARGDPSAAVAMVRGGIEALADQPDPNREVDLRVVEIAALRDLGGHEARVLALARQNLELSRAILHKDDIDLGVALNAVASALRDNGDPGAALDYRRQALDVIAHAAPADHVYVLGQRMNVALDLAATGEFEAARVEATAVLALAANKPAAEARRGLWLGDLASFTFSTGRIAEGLALFEQGLEQMSAQFGRDHPDVLEYRIVRLELEIEAGKLAEAEQHIAALERTYRTRGDRARDLTRLDGIDRGELALARHRPADAEVRARAALAAWSELHGNEEDREQLLRILGESLVDQHRWGEALEVLDRASAIWHARHELPDRLAQIDVQRARALAGERKPGDAVALARRARASLERFPADLRARAAADAFLAAHGRRDAARRRGDPR
ncbi:MAG TPA: hypothetical protein VHW23_17965, partial [Kofleriaceae bacterium]|nr:hypothetical protein [Kofleriaceae bacterium]